MFTEKQWLTIYLCPVRIREPLLRLGHVEDVPNEGIALGSWRQRKARWVSPTVWQQASGHESEHSQCTEEHSWIKWALMRRFLHVRYNRGHSFSTLKLGKVVLSFRRKRKALYIPFIKTSTVIQAYCMWIVTHWRIKRACEVPFTRTHRLSEVHESVSVNS